TPRHQKPNVAARCTVRGRKELARPIPIADDTGGHCQRGGHERLITARDRRTLSHGRFDQRVESGRCLAALGRRGDNIHAANYTAYTAAPSTARSSSVSKAASQISAGSATADEVKSSAAWLLDPVDDWPATGDVANQANSPKSLCD